MMKRQIKSFVIRSRLTLRQACALSELWDHYGVEVDEKALNFSEIFQNQAPVILEIGFGMGGSLLQLALQYPHLNFLGVEVHKPGVGALLADLAKAQICNVRIISKDASWVLDKNLPDESLLGVLLFFPDPWPKRRHHKRRIVQPLFVNKINQKLMPNGYFHLATDVSDYAAHMQRVIALHSGFAMIKEHSSAIKRPKTKFEARGERLGHKITDLIYERL